MLKEGLILARGLRGYSHHGRLVAVVAVFSSRGKNNEAVRFLISGEPELSNDP